MYSFVSAVANAPSFDESVITQFADQNNNRLISKLIRGISKVLQKLLNYFNGKTISTSFVLPAAGVSPIILVLNLNDSGSVILDHLYGAAINFLIFLQNYCCTVSDYTSTSRHPDFLHYLLEYYLFC